MTRDQASQAARPKWTSNFAFLIAAVGAAVGLGSLWRFPYVVGVSGGSAFLLVYLGMVALLCIPIMLAEMVIGRRGGGSAVESMKSLITAGGHSRAWLLIGWLSVVIPFLGLSYYSVVAGWVLDYMIFALVSGFDGLDAGGSQQRFEAMTGSVPRQLALHAGFIALAAFVVGRGIKGGIELASKVLMPVLFAILVGLVVYNVIAFDWQAGARFLFTPDFSKLDGEIVLMALGQAFYSTAIGVGVMMTYSAYLPATANLSRSPWIICGSVVLVACLAGLAVFPIVFHFGLAPDGGTNLSFLTLPVAFAQMPGGNLVGLLFFALVFVAAITTAFGMLEPTVAWVRGRTRLSRASATASVAALTWIIGLPAALSFNVLADFHPLSWLGPLSGKNVFEVMDLLIANVLLPVNACLIALFVAWFLEQRGTVEAAGLGASLRYRAWRILIGVVAPAAIIGILVDAWT